jgi:hypothetical protein
MSLLVRKIEKAKWLQNDIINGEDVSADAITLCMKTVANTLSVWEIDSETDLDEAVLGIVSGGQHLETIDIVTMDSQYLIDNGVDFVSNREGCTTPLEDIKKRHYNLRNLTYRKLGTIAYHIVDGFKNNRVERYTEGKLKNILRGAIACDRLNLAELAESMREKLE